MIVAIGLVALAACGSGKTSAPNATASTEAPTTSTSGAKNQIAMHLIAYTPASLAVPVGTKVTWEQQDAGFHTATSGTADVEASGNIVTHPDGTFRSKQLAKGERFSFAFTKAGTYRFFCEIHPATMRGEIKVG